MHTIEDHIYIEIHCLYTAPLRMTSSANTTPTSTIRAMSPPASGLSNSLTTTLPSPSTTGPSTSAGGSSGSGGTSPAVIKKAVTIPKIVTPVSGSPGLQKRETFHGLYPVLVFCK